MCQNFEFQKQQVQKLNYHYRKYIEKEFSHRNFDEYLSNPDRHKKFIYFHNANSEIDKIDILKSGYNESMMRNNYILGKGIYLGRDKTVLTKFYSQDFNNPIDNNITIKGNFKFIDLIKEIDSKKFMKKIMVFKLNITDYIKLLGFDGIRYYDPDATGEEFVLYNYKKLKFI